MHKEENHGHREDRHRSSVYRPAKRCAERKGGKLGSSRRERYREQHGREHAAHLQGCEDARIGSVYLAHYFYPTDGGWKINGPLETDEFRTHTFARSGQLNLTGFADSGADWLDRFKPYIEDGKTIVVSPHKVFGPQTNDLVLQLRKRGISKIILGGMLANMCVESHLRELIEQGFDPAPCGRSVIEREHHQAYVIKSMKPSSWWS
jgi:nicotinamidase-related amidase